MEVTLKKTAGLRQWLQVYRLYREAFPPSERKPFSVIVKMAKKGKTDVWHITANGRFAGFAATVNGPDTVMLDYFAVKPQLRGGGIGSRALAAFQSCYPGKGVFVEIESPYEDGPDKAARQRRKQFYRRCGLEPMQVMALVFGVKMELLGSGCRMDFDGYKAFYRDNYSPWAAEHLIYEPYPEE